MLISVAVEMLFMAEMVTSFVGLVEARVGNNLQHAHKHLYLMGEV